MFTLNHHDDLHHLKTCSKNLLPCQCFYNIKHMPSVCSLVFVTVTQCGTSCCKAAGYYLLYDTCAMQFFVTFGILWEKVVICLFCAFVMTSC